MRSVFLSLLLICVVTISNANETPVFAKLELTAITRNMTAINPRFNLIKNAQITFNNKSLELTLIRHMPVCPDGMMCAQVMPTPLVINLSVIEIKQTECSVKYTAATSPDIVGLVNEKVTVEDFTFTKCAVAMNTAYTPGIITYKVTGISSLTKQQETGSASFNVNGKFIRALY